MNMGISTKRTVGISRLELSAYWNKNIFYPYSIDLEKPLDFFFAWIFNFLSNLQKNQNRIAIN
jgi:hypothetical protein